MMERLQLLSALHGTASSPLSVSNLKQYYPARKTAHYQRRLGAGLCVSSLYKEVFMPYCFLCSWVIRKLSLRPIQYVLRNSKKTLVMNKRIPFKTFKIQIQILVCGRFPAIYSSQLSIYLQQLENFHQRTKVVKIHDNHILWLSTLYPSCFVHLN